MEKFNIENRRYLGSKTRLLPFLDKIIKENTQGCRTFLDLFGGTGVVANRFKEDYQVSVNDILFSNFVVYQCFMGNETVNEKKIERILETFNSVAPEGENYYSQNFADTYLSANNMCIVGKVREQIKQLSKAKEINLREESVLLTSLLYAVDKIANTVGHYDAFRKGGDLERKLVFRFPELSKDVPSLKPRIFNQEASELVQTISADIVYLDPPYNSRQYCDCYHFLENLMRDEHPKVSGVARKMDRSSLKSDYCNRSRASSSFRKLIGRIKAKYILVSYNNTGLTANDRSNARISDEDIWDILSSKGEVRVFEKEFPAFAANKYSRKDNKERVFFCKVTSKLKAVVRPSKKETLFFQSPLNYTGGKFKLLPQLMPLFPKRIDSFYDLFCGGFNVGINMVGRANQIIGVDNNVRLVELLEWLRNTPSNIVFSKVEKYVRTFGLSDTFNNGYETYGCTSSEGLGKFNKSGFLSLRSSYNKSPDCSKLLVLIFFAFNNQLRFNDNGEFNLPVGKRDFNARLRQKLSAFLAKLHSNTINFIAQDFKNLDIYKLRTEDFIYADPPYLLGTASYNENKGWSSEKEADLLDFLLKIDKIGVRFALSNVLVHKGKRNEQLIEWLLSSGFNLHYLNFNYSNSNYQLKDRTALTKEVLITNY